MSDFRRVFVMGLDKVSVGATVQVSIASGGVEAIAAGGTLVRGGSKGLSAQQSGEHVR